jgi:protein phosphatase-4 regulatory subunit 3
LLTPTVAVRFFRQLCWTPNNPSTAEFCRTYLLEKGAVARVLDLVMATLPRYNLLCSACLELFEHLAKTGPTASLTQFVEDNRDKLETLKGIEPFGQIILAPFDDATTDDDESRRNFVPGNGRYMEHITIDPAEEDYMNSADDENEDGHETDGGHPEVGAKTPAMDGSATPRQSLVDYTSDEEGDENTDPDDSDRVAASPRSVSEEDVGPASAPEAQTPAPLAAVRERTLEKRRREEEEDDAFGGLWQEKKRRNSAAASANGATTYSSDSSVTRPRRTSATLSRNSAPKRMQISLGGALKARTEASTEGNS